MKFRVLLVAFFILCFGTISSYGQYYRSAVAGSWSVASNWESSTDNIFNNHKFLYTILKTHKALVVESTISTKMVGT